MSKVLIVEDSADEIFLLKRAFSKIDSVKLIDVVMDGEAAISYLANPDLARPGLVFLDLQLPKRSGFEVLTWIRQQPSLRHMPVVILSSSTELRDVKHAYDQGANGYLEKTSIPKALDAMLQASSEFWLTWNHAPSV